MIPNIYDKLIMDRKRTSITKKEAEFIYSFLKIKKIKKSLEVGFAYGCSTAYIISAIKSKHYAIDPFQHNYKNLGLKNIENLKLSKYLKFEKDYAHNVLPKLLKQGLKIDFAFIDGGHKYDNTFISFYYIDLLLNQKGYVLFHDSWMRPTQLVASWIKKNKINYKLVKTPIKNFIMFQKIGRDKRVWWHFKEFYNLKSIIKHNLFKLTYKGP